MYDAEDLRLNFNPQYLLDGLGAIGSDTAVDLVHDTDPPGGADRQGRRRRLPVRADAHPERWLTCGR